MRKNYYKINKTKNDKFAKEEIDQIKDRYEIIAIFNKNSTERDIENAAKKCFFYLKLKK